MSADIAAQARRLRAQTCELLGLDPNGLSVTQQLRVSRASALRLQIDDLESAQLRGQPIDINKLVDASESLERLVGGNPEAPAAYDFSGAKEELDRLLVQRAAAIEHREQRESERLREENAKLREENTQLRQRNSEVVNVATSGNQSPQQSTNNNVVPIDAKERMRIEAQAAKERVAKESAQNERAFREHYESCGVVMAPAWTHPDERRR